MTRDRLSKHFVIEEFDCSDGTPVPKTLVPGLRLWTELWGEPFRAMFGQVTVHSGFRTDAFNVRVGGATQSVHLGRSGLPERAKGSQLRAAAGDVSAAHASPLEWADWARQHRARNEHLHGHGRGGIGTYVRLNFVHLDTWNERDWHG